MKKLLLLSVILLASSITQATTPATTTLTVDNRSNQKINIDWMHGGITKIEKLSIRKIHLNPSKTYTIILSIEGTGRGDTPLSGWLTVDKKRDHTLIINPDISESDITKYRTDTTKLNSLKSKLKKQQDTLSKKIKSLKDALDKQIKSLKAYQDVQNLKKQKDALTAVLDKESRRLSDASCIKLDNMVVNK